MLKLKSIPREVQVQACYGSADTYWDISFTRQQLNYAEVSDNEFNFISVFLAPSSGEIHLNYGYEEGSPQRNWEESLFANYKDSIVEKLAEEVPNHPDYAVFLLDAWNEKEERLQRLNDLAAYMAD